MKPIGGYFGLECGRSPLYHQEGIYLNSCRNALVYLIRALGIKRVHLPHYTCPSVADSIFREGCMIERYYLDREMMPCREFPKDDFIIYNDYFGTLGKNVEQLSAIYPNLIADNAQSFYSRPTCRAAVYSPRKFFGVPDGGILTGKDIPVLKLKKGVSTCVAGHLLKRLDFGAEGGYQDFVADESIIDSYPLQSMSDLTRAIMGNIDYDTAARRRLENFNFLNERLSTEFPLAMSDDDVPHVFPYLADDGHSLRERLISNRIYCACYWPEATQGPGYSSRERNLTTNLVAIPIDQRYGISEMTEILNCISHSRAMDK